MKFEGPFISQNTAKFIKKEDEVVIEESWSNQSEGNKPKISEKLLKLQGNSQLKQCLNPLPLISLTSEPDSLNKARIVNPSGKNFQWRNNYPF